MFINVNQAIKVLNFSKGDKLLKLISSKVYFINNSLLDKYKKSHRKNNFLRQIILFNYY